MPPTYLLPGHTLPGKHLVQSRLELSLDRREVPSSVQQASCSQDFAMSITGREVSEWDPDQEAAKVLLPLHHLTLYPGLALR